MSGTSVLVEWFITTAAYYIINFVHSFQRYSVYCHIPVSHFCMSKQQVLFLFHGCSAKLFEAGETWEGGREKLLFRVASSINSVDTGWGRKRLVKRVSRKRQQLCICASIIFWCRNCSVLDSPVQLPILINAHCQKGKYIVCLWMVLLEMTIIWLLKRYFLLFLVC